MKDYKICFFTGSRSEFGISKILIEYFNKFKLEYSLVVSGSHLMKDFGKTIGEIKFLKIKKLDKIKLNNYKEILHQNIHSNSFIKNCKYLKNKNYKYVILIGDRIETFSFALACFFLNIKIIHFHGGELTQGSRDNYYRNMISILSNYHFVSNKIYKKRLTSLGQEPKKIFNIGSLSLDKIKNYKLLNKEKFSNLKNISLFKKTVIITYHPLQNKKKTLDQIKCIIKVCHKFENVSFIFSSPSMDPNYKIIIKEIETACKRKKNFFYFKSLGHHNYVSLLKFSNLIVGNSSSGIIEAPFLKTPSIDIGDRQLGREKSSSVTCLAEPNKKNLFISINKLLYGRQKIKFQNKYSKKNSGQKFMKIFKDKILKDKTNKIFYELKTQ